MQHDLNQAALGLLAKAARVEVELMPARPFDTGPRLKIAGTGGIFKSIQYWEPYAKTDEALAVVSGMAAGEEFRGWALTLEFTGADGFAQMCIRNSPVRGLIVRKATPALSICWACLDVIQNQAAYLRQNDEWAADIHGRRMLEELASENDELEDFKPGPPF